MNLWEKETTSEDQPTTGLSFKLLLVRMFESSFVRAYFRIKSLMKSWQVQQRIWDWKILESPVGSVTSNKQWTMKQASERNP